jgi:hypothetical protein
VGRTGAEPGWGHTGMVPGERGAEGDAEATNGGDRRSRRTGRREQHEHEAGAVGRNWGCSQGKVGNEMRQG